jgi:hypothetical protein
MSEVLKKKCFINPDNLSNLTVINELIVFKMIQPCKKIQNVSFSFIQNL